MNTRGLSTWSTLLAAATLLPAAATGQSLFQLNGHATATTACSSNGDNFILTPDLGNQAGSVWRTRPITLARSFVFDFKVYLGTKNNGGDGMTFALQRNGTTPTTSLGGGGQNMGMAAIRPSVVVEFDTYSNGSGVTDIAADHLAIWRNGNSTPPVAGPIAAKVDNNGAAVDIENGQYYPVRIVWHQPTTTMTVYFDGVQRLSYQNDLVAGEFNSNPLVYWGFTASTGGATNRQEACSIKFSYDQDHDGVPDSEDTDDDNDGIADLTESYIDANSDSDNDGLLNYEDSDYGPLNGKGVLAALDTDGDGLIDQFDPDSDNDGIPDAVEANGGGMSSGFRAVYSAASGQLTGAVDAAGRPTAATAALVTLPDTDGDGLPDYRDINADNDAFPDWKEAFDDDNDGNSYSDYLRRAAAFAQAGGPAAYYPSTDANTNFIPDWLEDANNDGRPNFLDPTSSYYHDADGDGLIDLLDPSSYGTGYADVAGIPDVNANGISDYRDALRATPLPVELLSFEARAVGGQALLTWATASEQNSAYFEVQLSLDGRTFRALGQQPGQGSSSQRHEYRYQDAALGHYAAPLVYYRLRQVDHDGTASYSPVRALSVAPATRLALQAWPNPATGPLTLQVLAPQAGPAMLLVVAPTGQTLLRREVSLKAGATELPLPEAAQWPAGLYHLRVQQGTQAPTLRVVRR